jgi:type IX secretion system PorP/SprF family membrane protein
MVLLSVSAKAQDPHFSQYLSVPTYLNPAFAGYDGCSRFIASYRNQWPGFVSRGNYQTVQASYDQYVRPMRGGIGVNFQYDRGGDGLLWSYAASAVYSPVFRLFGSKLVVSPALELGWRQNAIDWNRMTFGTMIDPRYGFTYNPQPLESPNDRKDFFDASAGILFSHHNLVYGVAFHHLTQPDEGISGYSPLFLRSTAHATYHGQVTPRFSVSPSFIYMNQQDFHMFLHTLTFELYGARLGAGFRHHVSSYDAVILMAGYSHRRFSIGYSFDFTVSSLGMKTGGSHEINLALRFNCRNKEEWRKGPRLMGF